MIFSILFVGIGTVAVFVGALALLWRYTADEQFLRWWCSSAIAPLGFLIFYLVQYPIAGFCGGAGTNYAAGMVVGQVADSRLEGVIYNTCEITLHRGTDYVTDVVKLSKEDCSEVVPGMTYVFFYQKYWLPDYRRGSSGKYITEIAEVPDSVYD
jgi:hypothetical protein